MHATALLAALALGAGSGATTAPTNAAATAPRSTAPAPAPTVVAAQVVRTPEGFMRVEGAPYTAGAGSIASYDPAAYARSGSAPPPDVSPMAQGTGDGPRGYGARRRRLAIRAAPSAAATCGGCSR